MNCLIVQKLFNNIHSKLYIQQTVLSYYIVIILDVFLCTLLLSIFYAYLFFRHGTANFVALRCNDNKNSILFNFICTVFLGLSLELVESKTLTYCQIEKVSLAGSCHPADTELHYYLIAVLFCFVSLQRVKYQFLVFFKI